MSSSPAFASTPALGSALLVTAETDTLTPAQTQTIYTSPATRSVADGVTTAGNYAITSATIAFVAADEGKLIVGGGGAIPVGTVIAAVVSGTKALMSQVATASGTALDMSICGRGTRIEELVIQAVKTGTLIATTVAGLVYVYLYDGTTYRGYDAIIIQAITASSTNQAFHTTKQYPNLVLKPGWSLRCSQSIAGNASLLVVTAHGGDF